MGHEDLNEEIRNLKKRLKGLFEINTSLKQQISKNHANIQEKSNKDKETIEEQYLLQKALHGYAGVWATIKSDILYIQFNPSYKQGQSLGQYEIIFSIAEKFWKVVGCELPHSMCAYVHNKVLTSLDDLQTFLQSLYREIQAYVQRKNQVEFVERLFEDCKVPGLVWYSYSITKVLLRFPVTEANEKLHWEVHLQYDPAQCLPENVIAQTSADIADLKKEKFEVMSKKLDRLFKTNRLDVIMNQEFGNGDDNHDSTILTDFEEL